jgi:hypothetical protein
MKPIFLSCSLTRRRPSMANSKNSATSSVEASPLGWKIFVNPETVFLTAFRSRVAR